MQLSRIIPWTRRVLAGLSRLQLSYQLTSLSLAEAFVHSAMLLVYMVDFGPNFYLGSNCNSSSDGHTYTWTLELGSVDAESHFVTKGHGAYG